MVKAGWAQPILNGFGMNEDPIYRFYHQSYKVFHLQNLTRNIVDAPQTLSHGAELNPFFTKILDEGTGKTFAMTDNEIWLERPRPILEAFFHAKFFLEMAVKYGGEIDEPPLPMPSGWAALLYLFSLR
jgi:hypothetical protein